jgi:GGDEF domain-containing protein
LCVGASIGLALRRADRVDRDAIVRLADDALYEAKSYGRGVIREAVEASAA